MSEPMRVAPLEPDHQENPDLADLSGAGLEALGHAVVQAESNVSGPIYEIEGRLKDMKIGDVLKVKALAESRRSEIERETARRYDDIGRVLRAVKAVLEGKA